MPGQIPFQRSALALALLSVGFTGQAHAAAGRVEFVIGGAIAQGADGRQRALAKGLDLDSGDTVKTNDGRVQIRFTDGAYVSLQPNTEFSIKDYSYDGKADGSERGFFALARGAMRTVTGFIGRINRNRYQITTPTATVGIRGTGGLIAVNNDGSTSIVGTSGIWTLTNPAGTLDVPAGTVGLAPTVPNEKPKQTDQPPSVGPTPPPPVSNVFVSGDQTTSTGDPAALCGSGAPISGSCPTTAGPNPNPPLVTGSGYHVSYAYAAGLASPVSGIGSSGSLATATFDSAGMLTQFSATNSETFSGSHQEFGTAAGVVAWGRWIGPMTGVANISPTSNQGFHYVVGLPTPSMPVTGTATYTFVGATKPTGSDGTLTPVGFSGTLGVVFGSSITSLSLTATVAFSGFTYSLSGSASQSGSSPAFTGSMVGNVASGTAPAAYTCSSSCVASVNGAFFGAGASYAGYAYSIGNMNSSNTVAGAAVFKQ